MKGSVKKIMADKGFCFITKEGTSEDVFAHVSNFDGEDRELRSETFASLAVGQTVEFEIGQGPKGPHAINVRLVASEEAAA